MIFNFKKFKKTQFKKGMTYVELIVVLSIFSIMSAVTLVDYGKFQARVDIKNLANDIALQIVGAQKDAMAGKLTDFAFDDKPAYGVFFESANDGVSNKKFTYFADIDDTKSLSSGEELGVIQITKNNIVKRITIDGGVCSGVVGNVSIVFKRPDSSALVSTTANPSVCSNFSKVELYISSPPDGPSADIYIYPTGRIELK